MEAVCSAECWKISTRLQLLPKVLYAFHTSITLIICLPYCRAILFTTTIIQHPLIISPSMAALCRESLHLLGHSVRDAMLRDMTKGTPVLHDLYKNMKVKIPNIYQLRDCIFSTLVIPFTLICLFFFNGDMYLSSNDIQHE